MPIGLLLASKFWTGLRHLTEPGLLWLGLADNSLIPLPGSMDVLTIWFAVHHRHEWAVLRCHGSGRLGHSAAMPLTDWLAREAKRLLSTASETAGQLRSTSDSSIAFWAVAVPAVLPPPFPVVPFLLAAGAFEYSRQRCLAALTLGRTARYTILAYLGVLYGRHFLRCLHKYTKPTTSCSSACLRSPLWPPW